ncbi:protein of unknown function [Streptantibioticus cattleyicolor NRRL 8057 = DSM 46488]|nr:protein of unknown function [Streptantibioticus cattleyicolor NRRL 8057 = DSM 46488]
MRKSGESSMCAGEDQSPGAWPVLMLRQELIKSDNIVWFFTCSGGESG